MNDRRLAKSPELSVGRDKISRMTKKEMEKPEQVISYQLMMTA